MDSPPRSMASPGVPSLVANQVLASPSAPRQAPVALQENGCLQVVPGSHVRDFEHRPGHGLHAQGEWATPGEAPAMTTRRVTR